jgi:tRNA (guanine37-N1)-methyltransferase
MRLDILSLFPEMFVSPLSQSIIAKAMQRGLVEIHLHNIRDYATGKHRVTDDAPFGGGGGMIMKVEPIDRALEAIKEGCLGIETILLSPQGQLFNHQVAEELAQKKRLILVCGHYDGVDERVSEKLVDRELSIGDFVLTGGELAAMVVIDAVVRLQPGVLGNSASSLRDSFAQQTLCHPHYTRPAQYRGWQVPAVLISGHQEKVAQWRKEKALERTRIRRPDLLTTASNAKKGTTGEPFC